MQIKTADGEKNVSSQGVGGTGLGLGIAGTALGLLNGGILGALNGGNNKNANSDNEYLQMIGTLKSTIAQVNAERYADNTGINTFKEAQTMVDKLSSRVATLENFAHETDKKNAVLEAVLAERLNCMNGRIATIEGLTKVVVPNDSVCPGWGNVTITPATSTTTTK